jgi:hypothetical protein
MPVAIAAVRGRTPHRSARGDDDGLRDPNQKGGCVRAFTMDGSHME